MDTSNDADQENSLKFIRKLRKKLRQIERLERGQRELTDEEKIKLSCKYDIREKLQLLLSTINEADISFDSIRGEDSEIEERVISEGPAKPNVVDVATALEQKSYVGDQYGQKVQTKDSLLRDNETKIASLKTENLDFPKSKIERLKKVPNMRSSLRKQWRNSVFQIVELEGHNDVICSVDAADSWAISGSRDTTLKLWDINTAFEIRNIGGHTGQVTAVILLTSNLSDDLRKELDPRSVEAFVDIDKRENKVEKLAISGSTDCSVRLWLLPHGLCVKSLYNYNPVSALFYMNERKFVFVGSSSGNLTVYNLSTSAQVYSSTIHDSQITKIQVLHGKVYTSSSDGCLKVWRIECEKTKMTKLENVRFSNLEFGVSSDEFDITLERNFENHGNYIEERQIHDFLLYDEKIHFGDDGVNLKIWQPETDELSKLRNHKPNVPGITDCLVVDNELLFATSYNLDTGTGSINVRSLMKECHGIYIASFSHEHIPRLTCLTCTTSEGTKFLISGGKKLFVWKLEAPGSEGTQASKNSGFDARGENIPEMTKPAIDSDIPSEDESSGAEDEGKWFWQWKTKSSPTTKSSRKSSSGAGSDFGETEDSIAWEQKSSVNNTSRSLFDWCDLI